MPVQHTLSLNDGQTELSGTPGQWLCVWCATIVNRTSQASLTGMLAVCGLACMRPRRVGRGAREGTSKAQACRGREGYVQQGAWRYHKRSSSRKVSVRPRIRRRRLAVTRDSRCLTPHVTVRVAKANAIYKRTRRREKRARHAVQVMTIGNQSRKALPTSTLGWRAQKSRARV